MDLDEVVVDVVRDKKSLEKVRQVGQIRLGRTKGKHMPKILKLVPCPVKIVEPLATIGLRRVRVKSSRARSTQKVRVETVRFARLNAAF